MDKITFIMGSNEILEIDEEALEAMDKEYQEYETNLEEAIKEEENDQLFMDMN